MRISRCCQPRDVFAFAAVRLGPSEQFSASAYRQRASRYSQFATAIRVSLNPPAKLKNTGVGRCGTITACQVTRHASSGEQAAYEERPPLRTRRRGRASRSTEVKRRQSRIFSKLTVYFTVGVGSGRLTHCFDGGQGQNRTADTRIFRRAGTRSHATEEPLSTCFP
jgi:hypothetical protein